MDDLIKELAEIYDSETLEELTTIAKAYEGIGMSIEEIKTEFKNDYNIEFLY
ncbi:MAG TPA: hypothetical protein VJI69_02145 [Bacteroidia bacterium]|nr:hypothetical protein [Bacteroidia bacterium]